MEKKLRFILLGCGLVLSCGAAPSDKRGSVPQLAPPPIFSQWEQKNIQVVETGEFSSMAVPERKTVKQKSSSSAADLVSEKGKKFFWKPSPLLSSTIRVADLTGAALSEDGSLAVITERIGGAGKANSTRVLLFDIPNRRLAGGFVIPKERLSSITFLPGPQTDLIAIRTQFAPFKTKNGLVRIDLRERKIVDYFDAPENKSVTSFVCGKKGKLFLTVAGSPVLYEIDADAFAVEPVSVKSRLSSPKVCVTGELLIAYGKEGVETFRKDEGRWIADEALCPFPEPFEPVKSTVIDATFPAICFSGTFEEDLWYYRKGSFRKLQERISGISLWNEPQKLLFSEAAANSKIVIFQMPEGSSLEKGATPNRLKPASRNGSFAFLGRPALKNKIVQIDNRGNVFVLDHSRITRWKKYIVYIADRAGFR